MGAASLAAAAPSGLPTKPTGSLELGMDHAALSAGYPAWSGTYLRATLQQDERNTWLGELAQRDEFDDRGVYYSVRNTHQFGSKWFTHLSLGSSSGGFFLPRVDSS